MQIYPHTLFNIIYSRSQREIYISKLLLPDRVVGKVLANELPILTFCLFQGSRFRNVGLCPFILPSQPGFSQSLLSSPLLFATGAQTDCFQSAVGDNPCPVIYIDQRANFSHRAFYFHRINHILSYPTFVRLPHLHLLHLLQLN